MTEQEVSSLIEKFRSGTCTVEERALVMSWYNSVAAKSTVPETIPDFSNLQQEMWTNTLAVSQLNIKASKRRTLYQYAAAAAVLILVTSFAYLFFRPANGNLDLYTYNKQHDVPAGTNRAILTLANGNQIILDDAKAGAIASQSGVTITKNSSGQLVYHVSGPSPAEGDGEARAGKAYNAITTPNGGQYQVILPDGSIVYLNAASSLKYPVKFNSGTRKVELEGEAYFEVAKNPAQPFIVSSTSQIIRVLGTHFNVSSYPDEQLKTTLAEGKIEIQLNTTISPQNGSHLPSKVLTPGQQAINDGTALMLKNVNVDDETGWKDGLFIFNQTSTKNVFQQISRWYDVTVDYSSLPDGLFDGAMSKNQPLSELLKAIEVTNHVKIKIEGRRITVQK